MYRPYHFQMYRVYQNEMYRLYHIEMYRPVNQCRHGRGIFFGMVANGLTR